MEWQETLFSPNHSESHELPFIWMGGDNLSWGGASRCVHPSWRIANTDVEFLFSWDISRQIKATIPSLEHFYFWIPEGSYRFPNKEVSFLLAITFGDFFPSFYWKLVWGGLKRNYLRDAGAQDLEFSKYFIKKISLLCCKDKKNSLLCKFF